MHSIWHERMRWVPHVIREFNRVIDTRLKRRRTETPGGAAPDETPEEDRELRVCLETLRASIDAMELLAGQVEQQTVRYVNTELRDRSEQLNRTNSFLASVFASLRSDEVRGQPLLNLDIGLPIGGKAIRCRISVRPLAAQGLERRGVILLMDEVEE